jgi:hydrogenase expression/formation protein HypE
MIGKVSPDDLAAHVFSHTGAESDAVVQGPAYGEDAAAIDLGGQLLVVSSDPISLAIGRVGTLGVNVACNDVAASGGDPEWLTAVVHLPGDVDDGAGAIEVIAEQLDEAAKQVGVAIVGGHSEYDPGRDRPLLGLTCMGTADRFVATGGAQPGDRVLLTKGAAIEGTAILATDFTERLSGVSPATIERAGEFYDEISVIEDARAVREYATAMHDPTEGGLIDGLLELATASGVDVAIDRDAIPIRDETATICDAAGVDPLRIFGSGALVATVPEDAVEAAVAALDAADVTAAEIGEVRETDDPALRIDGQVHADPVRDDLYDLWE